MIDRDLFQLEAEEVLTARVVRTVIDGRDAYRGVRSS
jgi:predicted amidohydrolase YtcJ